MQKLTTSGRISVISSMAMTPAALTSKVNLQGECKVDAPVAVGSWATENILPEIDTKFMSHAQPSTPQLLSSSNSVTYFKSINRRQKGKKSRTSLAPLFKKRLTLKVLGLKNLPVCNYGLEYSTRETQPRADEANRLASQDLLIFKSPLMPVSKEVPTLEARQSSNDSIPKALKPSNDRRRHSRASLTTNSKSSTSTTLTQHKRLVKTKLKKCRHSGHASKPSKNRKFKSHQLHNNSDYQQTEKIEMNTGTLYLYRGGDMPRRAVFIRRK